MPARPGPGAVAMPARERGPRGRVRAAPENPSHAAPRHRPPAVATWGRTGIFTTETQGNRAGPAGGGADLSERRTWGQEARGGGSERSLCPGGHGSRQGPSRRRPSHRAYQRSESRSGGPGSRSLRGGGDRRAGELEEGTRPPWLDSGGREREGDLREEAWDRAWAPGDLGGEAGVLPGGAGGLPGGAGGLPGGAGDLPGGAGGLSWSVEGGDVTLVRPNRNSSRNSATDWGATPRVHLEAVHHGLGDARVDPRVRLARVDQEHALASCPRVRRAGSREALVQDCGQRIHVRVRTWLCAAAVELGRGEARGGEERSWSASAQDLAGRAEVQEGHAFQSRVPREDSVRKRSRGFRSPWSRPRRCTASSASPALRMQSRASASLRRPPRCWRRRARLRPRRHSITT